MQTKNKERFMELKKAIMLAAAMQPKATIAIRKGAVVAMSPASVVTIEADTGVEEAVYCAATLAVAVESSPPDAEVICAPARITVRKGRSVSTHRTLPAPEAFPYEAGSTDMAATLIIENAAALAVVAEYSDPTSAQARCRGVTIMVVDGIAVAVAVGPGGSFIRAAEVAINVAPSVACVSVLPSAAKVLAKHFAGAPLSFSDSRYRAVKDDCTFAGAVLVGNMDGLRTEMKTRVIKAPNVVLTQAASQAALNALEIAALAGETVEIDASAGQLRFVNETSRGSTDLSVECDVPIAFDAVNVTVALAMNVFKAIVGGGVLCATPTAISAATGIGSFDFAVAACLGAKPQAEADESKEAAHV
jgi:hypothetical protein